MPADFEYGCDVRVSDRRAGARLAMESFFHARIGSEVSFEQFQDDAAADVQIFGEVDYAHAALSEVTEDAVMRNLFSDPVVHPVECASIESGRNPSTGSVEKAEEKQPRPPCNRRVTVMLHRIAHADVH